MNKLKLHSPNITEANIEKIAELFPSCILEARDDKGELTRKIDFDQLRQELSDSLVEGSQERYRLDWPGKRESLLAANAPIAKTLRPDEVESKNFKDTRNLVIEGDNLEALKLLQETYLGRVKMIYIDPPYNTGNEFIYNDDFAEDTEDFLARSNQIDRDNIRLVANTESNGRFHSDWLSMIYPRLRLARNLLKDDGCIFISIDDHEVGNLRKVCDEIFGEQNFVATIIWQKVFSPKNTAAYFSEDHDYLLVYAKNKSMWKPTLLPRSKESEARYTNPDDDTRGPWLSGAIQARNYYSKGQYTVTSPSGNQFTNPKGTYWRFSEEKFKQLDNDNRIWWGESGGGVPRLKRFLTEVKSGVVPQTLWKYETVGHTQEAKEELIKFVDFTESENVLNSVKPSRLLAHAVRIGTTSDQEDIVLDFFAGSGPTAQAVLSLNAEDEGNRKFVLVQIPEKLPKPEEKTKTIADLAKSRIRNSGEHLKEKFATVAHKLDVGFRVLKVDTSNAKDIYYTPDAIKQEELALHVDHIKEDRTAEDLLFQVMLDWGVDLALPISKESIQEKDVYFVDENAIAACFETAINEDFVKELAKREPLRVVFRDTCFESDSAKINVAEIFKLLSPNTDIKTI